MNLTGQKLFYYGVIILLFQNILFELFSFLYVESMLGYNSNSVFFLTLYPDLVGFFLLGLGYIVHQRRNGSDKRFMFAGIFIMGWLLVRLIWQFFILDMRFLNIKTTSSKISLVYFLLFIGSILLLFAAFFVKQCTFTGGDKFFTYAFVNFIATLFMLISLLSSYSDRFVLMLYFGLMVKFFFVPIFGVWTFNVMRINSKLLFGISATTV